MIKAMGIHVYLGGFALGVAKNPNVSVVGSIETWKPAVQWSPRLGMNVLLGAQPVDYLFANPPCARFSAMSFSKFDNSMREDLDSFPEMLEVLDAAVESGAELVHVESGPMLFSQGDVILDEFASRLPFDPYVIIIKIDATHAGLPQFRPRTHFFAAKRPFPEMDFSPVQGPQNVGTFMQGWNASYNYEPVPVREHKDPVVYASMEQKTAVFLSTRSKIISREDKATPSVVSSRPFVWLEENRWWTVDEFAAVQGYPAGDFDYAEPGIPLATALISKSVSPSVASYLTERVVVPYFDTAAREPHQKIKVNLT